MRRMRVVIGVLLFALSITLLIWAYKPLDRIKRTQTISPQDLQLPTPVSLLVPPVSVS